jgi:hypothetical protein
MSHELFYLDLRVTSDPIRSDDQPSDSDDVFSQEGGRTRAACAVRDIAAAVVVSCASNQTTNTDLHIGVFLI